MNLTLEGKNALVGGGSAGIGLSAAIELSKLGATVTLISRTESALKKAVSLLDCSLGQQHGYIVADYEQPELLMESVRSELACSVFHILVNNTGGPAGGPLINAVTSDFTRAVNNHLLCNHLLVQELVPGMKQEGYGRIKYGITVNNVLPGYTHTARLEEIIVKRVAASGLTRESVVQNMLNSVPARRFAEPAEVAAAVAFLATPAASYVNGINLPVDGGRTRSI
ncbi:MAG: SDR family oxidoreductase [Saprospiraceae bacterium]|nr:SDR family oxidoreductase [Saprospiraceae bacterium]